jgi:6-hydroxynicotinate 3-monooxygenase
MGQRPRIAIVGAGLGGTTATILLQRAGYDVATYEQAPGLERVGAGINIDPPVIRILRRLGVEPRLKAIGRVSERRLSREWDTGAITFDVPVARYPELYDGYHFSIHRGDLQEALADAVAPGAIQLGKCLTALRDDDDGITLRFADGTSARADLVIGADGVNSRVREILLGPEPPRYTGKAAYRAIFPTSRLGSAALPADHVKWFGPRPDQYFLTYYLTQTRDVFYTIAITPEPWEGADFAPTAADPARYRAAFAGYHEEVQRVIAAVPPEAMSRWAILERAPQPLWSRGRVVMLGDACHPMPPHMGQGAGMAFEDAVMLVRCLEACPGPDPAAAFALYEAQRFARTARVQRESAANLWLRYPMDPGWVLSYDAFTIPLQAPPPDTLSGAA